jgi:hypothetical protein
VGMDLSLIVFQGPLESSCLHAGGLGPTKFLGPMIAWNHVTNKVSAGIMGDAGGALVPQRQKRPLFSCNPWQFLFRIASFVHDAASNL